MINLTNAQTWTKDVATAINHEGRTSPFLHLGQPKRGHRGRAPGHFARTLHRRGGQGVSTTKGHPHHRRCTVDGELPPASG
jgi:hypothetical protein